MSAIKHKCIRSAGHLINRSLPNCKSRGRVTIHQGMAIRLIAVDLDGTLLNSHQEISQPNRDALQAVARRGIELLVTTGRRFHSARSLLDSLPYPVTVVASNGALIASLAGNVFRRDFLPRKTAQQVLDTAIDYRPYAVAIFHMPGQGQVMMQHNASPDGPLRWYLKTAPECLAQVANLPASLPEDPVQVMFGGPPALLDPLETLLRSSPAREHIHLTWTKYFTRGVSLLDVMNRGCSKGSALGWWLNREGFSPSEVMAIGDNYNDLEMLQMVGCPVVMGNACPELYRDGWHVTLSNDENGVEAALRTFALL
ncbi:MAG: Cof-type HAD-IIB family hydrolase [Acidobacteria bacterium]|nr:Cof-type HAD-IIB family hydrolase [Acidobacteriota bacterium]